jgi:hypothetical protein
MTPLLYTRMEGTYCSYDTFVLKMTLYVLSSGSLMIFTPLVLFALNLMLGTHDNSVILVFIQNNVFHFRKIYQL